ncbi:MAG: cadherin-like beta sandwich domain-containing protein [Clostridiales bacterium]|nr:cadherin-like beta sandwich domain-containing protein [Clostridiales bacterium]
MMNVPDRKGYRVPAKLFSALSAFVIASVVCLSCMFSNVNADSEVVISAVPKQTDIGPGDIVIVDVVADRMPGITEFGPVVFSFDPDQAEYISFEQGKELSNYVFYETKVDGNLSITGKDQMTGIGVDDNGEETVTAFFSSEEQVTLFSVVLRLFPDSSGEVNCWISGTGDFVSPGENITVRTGSGVTLPIRRTGLSSDATIASLKVRGATITPEFNPNITDYSCSVERSVTEVQVNVIASNLWAAVIVDGNQHLSIGENIVSINVTAQDGSSHMRYTIHVERSESDVPNDASLVDLDGNTYTFLDAPGDVQIPSGFTQTTRTINGYTVPAYVREGVTSILIYLFDGTQSPGFYFYNSNAKTVRRYDPENTIIEDSAILKVAEIPSGVVIPDEFSPEIFDTGSMILSGYSNKEGDFIIYLSDENGNRDFYFYDRNDGSISLYRFADKKAERLYSFLFDVFLVIAIIEAVIITVTVYIVRRLVSDRTNPRPKRV